MEHYSDKELLEKFRNPSSKSYGFNLLVRKYQERLYWHIRRIVINHEDANDIIQNVLIKVWKGLENFREESGLYTWLYRIATNESITFLNKKKKKMFVSMVDVENKLSNSLESDVYYEGDEIQEKLQKALLTLPTKQRIVFNMKYYEEMKYEEMSDVLETSVGSLKASYHHAVKKVEKHLKEN